MKEPYRFGVSLEKRLIDEFDRHIAEKGYENRSEAIRDLIRAELVGEAEMSDSSAAGVISMAYDHHKRDLVSTLIDIQHDFHEIIISSQHIHLDHDNCLEILAVKGKARELRKLSDLIRVQSGVLHVSLNLIVVPEEHSH